MAYAVNPYTGQQMPVNPAPGPGGGIGGGMAGGGQQGIGFLGGGPIPQGMAAFKDPRMLRMLAGVMSGAQSGRNPLSGAIQGGFGAMDDLQRMEAQAQQAKMQKSKFEMLQQEADRREKKFQQEQDRLERERDRIMKSEESKRDFLERFTNGGMGTKQEGEGQRRPGGGLRQRQLAELGMANPEMADWAIKQIMEQPDKTSLQQNIEYMQSLPPGDPRRQMMAQSLTKPSVSISQGPEAPDLPANYMWQTPEDPAKSGYAVKKLPGLRESGAEAGKSALLAQGIRSAEASKELLFNPDGSPNYTNLITAFMNIPRTEGSLMRSNMEEAIRNKLRLESGAEIKDSEVQDQLSRYLPPPWAGADLIREAFDSFRYFMDTALEETNPALFAKLNKRAGGGKGDTGGRETRETDARGDQGQEKVGDDALEDAFQKYGF